MKTKFCIIKLGEVAKVISGYAFKSNDLNNDLNDIPVVKINNIKNGYVNLNECSYVSREFLNKINEKYLLNKGDLLISLTGSHLSQPNSVVGRIAKYRLDNISLLNQRAGKISVKKPEKLNLDFLYYYLSHNSLRVEIASKATGAANQANISPSDVEEINLLIPEDVEVQRNIAEILNNYEQLIEINQKRIVVLEKMLEQLYKEWFVRMRFPNYEEVKFVKGLPENWEVKTLNSLINDIIDKRGITPAKLGYDWSEDGIKAVSALNIKKGHLVKLDDCKKVSEELYSKWMSKNLEAFDILMTSEAPLGELYFLVNSMKLVLSQRVFCIRANSKKISPFYLYMFLSSQGGQSLIQAKTTGSTVGGIRQKLLRKVDIIVPDKQLMIDFEILVKPIFIEIDNLVKQNENLIHTKNLLLPRLISGQLYIKPDACLQGKETITPFKQKQILAYIIKKQHEKNMPSGEMVLAKNTYLVEKLYGVYTGFNWQNWHFGTYDGAIRKMLYGKDHFFVKEKMGNSNFEVLALGKNQEKILDKKYYTPNIEKLEKAMDDLLEVYSHYPSKERSKKIELLNTTCKAISDTQSLNLNIIRNAFKEWKTEKADFPTKWNKFTEEETEECIQFIIFKGWDKKLLTN
ncbi:restriction endonuclease subunit S [Chryseobacterium sp. 22458]|uniref:restriction endonuclease subunit S n=1 Tax=Chryseobacterium sp. 22458 TaxID=3453921 RepID=UPI003F82E063